MQCTAGIHRQVTHSFPDQKGLGLGFKEHRDGRAAAGQHWVPDRWAEHDGRYRYEPGRWER